MSAIDPGEILLEHYGVKGMKWGVRRSQASLDRSAGRKQKRAAKKQAKKARDAPNRRYGQFDRAHDRSTGGRRYEKRVNRRMNSGDSLTKARMKQTGSDIAVAAGVMYLGNKAIQYGPAVAQITLQALADRKNANIAREGAKAAANAFSDSKGIANHRTIPLRFNNVTNIWE